MHIRDQMEATRQSEFDMRRIVSGPPATEPQSAGKVGSQSARKGMCHVELAMDTRGSPYGDRQ